MDLKKLTTVKGSRGPLRPFKVGLVRYPVSRQQAFVR